MGKLKVFQMFLAQVNAGTAQMGDLSTMTNETHVLNGGHLIGSIQGNASELAQQPAAEEVNTGIMHFIAQSDWVGQGLFIILVLMSVATWYLVIFKSFNQWRLKKKAHQFLNLFWSANSLKQVEDKLNQVDSQDAFSKLAQQALQACAHQKNNAAKNLAKQAGIESFLMRIMRKTIAQETAKLENGLTLLASIASTSPFIGLFGTVWGVYHALVNIGLGGDVALSNIAGPVGEALIMTGLGLAVAIPAVIAYNAFIRSNRVYLARLDAFAHDLYTFLTVGPVKAA